jgi:hypothetical protein
MAVTFQAEGHIYRNEQGEVYTSVTTLIGKYKAPFDSAYWSLYKAIKLVLESKGEWSSFKKMAGGWDNVVAYYKTQNNFPYADEVIKAQRQFLESWDEAGKVARIKGSEYHNMRESLSHERGVEFKNQKAFKVLSPVDLLSVQNFDGDGVFTELLLYNDHFRIAGMADKVLKEGRWIHIHDYKTSREIEFEAFQDQRMKEPISHLPSCNYYEYSLQLSIYAWMLEVMGYRVGELFIEHVPNGNKLYEVKYLRNEVQNLLTHYGKSKNIPRFAFPAQGSGESIVDANYQTRNGQTHFIPGGEEAADGESTLDFRII